jgi:hypothetical protein
MTAIRILLLVLALAVVGFVAKVALTGSVGGGESPGRSAPARQLDNVRERAQQLEGEMQRSADRAERPAEQEP